MTLRINRVYQITVDAVLIALGLAFGYLIRFEGLPPRLFIKQFILLVPYAVAIHLVLLGLFGVYRLVWRYVSLRDSPRILAASLSGTLMLLALRFLVGPVTGAFGVVVNAAYATVPYGVIMGAWVYTTVGIFGVRLLWRTYHEQLARRKPVRGSLLKRQRALLLGAGSAGVIIARELKANPSVGFDVLGFLDDDARKHGLLIEGHRVLGSTDCLPEFAARFSVHVAIVSMARVPAQVIRRLVKLAEDAEIRIQIIPGLYEILSGAVNISKVRDVAIEDLLGRELVHLDEELIAQFVRDKVVLITGAGGSIGSEMCRQVARFNPKRLVMLDQAENPLFYIDQELAVAFPTLVRQPLVANIVDRSRLKGIFQTLRPQLVFHAAAHKHVPLMEASPSEAIRNNVVGSCHVADLAQEVGAEALVMISTDKAVNPTSVMGATKRLAEMYVQALAPHAATRLITVRFGNVLGSAGSVIPVFKEQIARGGPVTVTHPEMKRYFMAIPEASQLVLQAAVMGQGGEIFILEMGKPISIVSLARDLIRLSGFVPDEEIAIAFTGIRPGEKLLEEINLSEENAQKTRHARIWIGNCQSVDLQAVRRDIEELRTLADGALDAAELRVAIARCVKEYKPFADTSCVNNTNSGQVG